MDKNVLFLVNSSAIEFAKKLVEKADDYGVYTADSSVLRTMRILVEVLHHECCYCYIEKRRYSSFIADLLGTMLANADKGVYKNEMDVSGIMAELPFMSISGIQKTIMENSSNIALFEMVYDEYTNLRFVDDSAKKEDGEEEFLLKKIDAE